jgi:hypothetical protein
MSVQLATIEDLENMKVEIISSMTEILGEKNLEKPWLRSREVQKLLNISAGTLQNFRISGVLPYSKVNGVLFYETKDVLAVLEKGKVQR